MKSNKKNYFIIVIYGLLLVFLLLGVNNYYGSNTDWISQHIVIPDYLRSIFYETKNILPNLAINIGAGQNIFNFSYYGLLSPIILISYILPFINMTNYIVMASIVLYILSGILIYKFLNNNKFSNPTSLFLALSFLTLGFTYHFHHHIMFVWNLPFVILSLMGVDKYVNKNKSGLLMISTFLMIMVNYYYSVPGLLCILIYGLYKLLAKENFKLKNFWLDLFKASIRIIIPILMAGVLLIPTANIILETGRTLKSDISLIDLLIPNFDEVTYKSFSMGLTGLMLLSPIGLLLSKKKNKGDIFLNIVLIILTFIPFFMYILNGFLYIRGKVLIPLSILYIFTTAKLIKEIKDKNIDMKKLLIASLGLIILILVIKTNEKMLFLSLDILIMLGALYLLTKYKKEVFVYIPLLLILIIHYYNTNIDESFVSVEKYQDINSKSVAKLVDKLPQNDFYRTYNLLYTLETSNKYYAPNYYGISMYSSNYNKYYGDFYNEEIANNIVSRNSFVMAGSNNELYYNFMGVKYVISKNSPGVMYEKIAEEDGINLYYNENAYPIIYATNSYGSYMEYKELEFPYNLEYMLQHPLTNDLVYLDYQTNLKELNKYVSETYEFTIDKTKKYTYELSKPITSKYLLIKFNMAHHPSCEEGDNYITINGIKNKLTCNEWMYHNQNYEFEYVIPTYGNLESLDIKITKGNYKINNLKVYTYDFNPNDYQNLTNIKIDKAKSIITGQVNLDTSGYIITSLPFDKGYKTYVDNKEVKSEIVNNAFLGFKVSNGNHNIKITYHSPWLIFGYLTSIIGVISYITILIYEKYFKKINKLLKKYKEIIMYLIFGVLTTLVSIVSYYLLTKTLLNPQDKLELQIANVISWIIAVSFAYITNRKYVFASKNKNVIKEALKFYESRIITLLLDMILMFIFVSCLKYNDTIIKIIDQILVIIGNYILSKLIVFKKGVNK